jgi:hypothetical protein
MRGLIKKSACTNRSTGVDLCSEIRAKVLFIHIIVFKILNYKVILIY